MKSQRLQNLFGLLLGLMFFVVATGTGCEEVVVGNEFLSKPPELDYTLDSAFVSSLRAKEVLWNAYSTLPWGLPIMSPGPGDRGGVGRRDALWTLTDLMSHDVGWTDVGQWYANGTYDAEAASIIGNNWRLPDKYVWLGEMGWEGIRDAFIFIDNVDKVPDMTQSEKDRLKAEAKMIIATHYVHMFRNYGGPLYVDKAFKPTDNTNEVERLTVIQTVDTLTTLIDEARADLPFELEDPDQWSGRFTEAGAMALKVQLLEFAAAPLFNSNEPYMQGEAASKHLVWTGGYERDLWVRLRDAAKELIDRVDASAYYGLVDTGNPMQDYRSAYFDRGTGETLISTRYRHAYAGGFWNPPTNFTARWSAQLPVLYNYVEKFPMTNGINITNSNSGYDPQNPWVDRDPRLFESVLVNGRENFQNRRAETWIGGRERRNKNQNNIYTGFKLWKWVMDAKAGSSTGQVYNEEMHWPYIRLPEIYLAYAEALNELNDGPTAEAYEYVNKVRQRVDVGPIENNWDKPRLSVTKEEFLEALLNERIRELGMEDVRWYDMARYKLETAFTKDDRGMDVRLNATASGMNNFNNFFQNNVSYSDHGQYFNHEITVLERGTFAWKTDFSPKYYLSAFPSVEVQKGYGLTQNPGYETSASN